jgi:small subunit ribosomal protein S20
VANTAQARKRVRQAEKRRLHNHSQKSAMRTAIKKVLVAIHEKKMDVAKDAFKTAATLVDRLSRRNLITKNKAARIKSRLNTRIKATCQ